MELPSDQEIDALARLEERILQAAEMVATLRQEKDAAVREAAEARLHASKVSLELEALRGEREQVRARIEKLVGYLDRLSAG